MTSRREECIEAAAKAYGHYPDDDWENAPENVKRMLREGSAAAFTAIDTVLSGSLTRACEGDGWRDIASAPKNGTRIWLADAKHVVSGYWNPHYGTWWCDEQFDDPGARPTHWQPHVIPPSPSGARP